MSETSISPARLAAAILAFETQNHALLSALVRGGLDPELVWQGLRDAEQPADLPREIQEELTSFMGPYRALLAQLTRERRGKVDEPTG